MDAEIWLGMICLRETVGAGPAMVGERFAVDLHAGDTTAFRRVTRPLARAME